MSPPNSFLPTSKLLKGCLIVTYKCSLICSKLPVLSFVPISTGYWSRQNNVNCWMQHLVIYLPSAFWCCWCWWSSPTHHKASWKNNSATGTRSTRTTFAQSLFSFFACGYQTWRVLALTVLTKCEFQQKILCSPDLHLHKAFNHVDIDLQAILTCLNYPVAN